MNRRIENPRPDVEIVRADRIGNQIRWPVRFARLLGKISDAELAIRMGVAITTVVSERRRRGVAASRLSAPPVRWTPEMDALLGEAPDNEVALELEVSKSSVQYRRRVLGIPAHGGRRRRQRRSFWTPARLAWLGTDFDLHVARKLRISRARVAFARRVRGIPPFVPKPAKVNWTPSIVARLGRDSDRAIARRYRIDEGSVRRERNRRGIPPVKRDSWKVLARPELRRVLRLHTAEVVRRTGLNVKTIHRLRKELGIASPGHRSAWTPRALAWLGKLPDEEIARRLGLKPDTVKAKRVELRVVTRPARRWTPEEIAIARRHSPREAARRTGRTLRAIDHVRRRLGLN